jgi:hypothetical protein
VRNGKLATIIFIRDRNKRGQEVSGYIDYGARLKAGSWEALFERRAKLLPRPGDLSFYNWDTHVATANASPNFLVGGAAAGHVPMRCSHGLLGVVLRAVQRAAAVLAVAWMWGMNGCGLGCDGCGRWAQAVAAGNRCTAHAACWCTLHPQGPGGAGWSGNTWCMCRLFVPYTAA